MGGLRQQQGFMAPGGLNDSLMEAQLDPKRNEAPVVWNGEFTQKGAVRKRRGCLRIFYLDEITNPTGAPTLEAT